MSDCKPLELQRLASHSVSAMFERMDIENDLIDTSGIESVSHITIEDVSNAINATIDQKKWEFEELWNVLNEEQKNTLRTTISNNGYFKNHGEIIFSKKTRSNISRKMEGGSIRLTQLFTRWLEGDQ
jgi:hypothetical protein